ncbi:MAG: FAD-dependent oxidoreductase [Tissierellia bacterium]|nr:FAD-dependent oxidoreductase [Tissierellia bacterium]
MKYIIIGGVAGGASAAARLRRLEEDAEIILFERGEYISFANCGLPYHISEVIPERDSLLVQTVAGMSRRFNLDIRNFSEVQSIDPDKKEVEVKNLETGKTYKESYDKLLLSPGAQPVKPPIPGLDQAKNLFTLRTIPDTDAIKAYVEDKKVKKAVVVGGGFIGLEMVENLAHLNIEVDLVEMSPQVMAPLDLDMAKIVHRELVNQGVKLHLEDGLASIEEAGKKLVLSSGQEIETDLIILSIGVKPENSLAKSAGLDLGPKGHIKVNDRLETSKKDIYAVGDAIEFKGRILGEDMALALAGPANHQAHLVADIMTGLDRTYKGFVGTSVAKVFNLTVASTGLNEKKLEALGKKDYESIHLHPMNHAGYYPDAQALNLKLIFSREDGSIYGGQIVGTDGVDKRIDVLATAISGGLKVKDLTSLELAYAPPYSSAKDPINMAGYVATNILEGLVDIVHVQDIDQIIDQGGLLIDVRDPEEVAAGGIPGAINIPLNDLRDRLDEIPKDKPLYISCQVGLRGYLGTRFLAGYGLDAKNLDGGYSSYSQWHDEIPNSYCSQGKDA